MMKLKLSEKIGPSLAFLVMVSALVMVAAWLAVVFPGVETFAARKDAVEQSGQYVFLKDGALIENETIRNGVYLVIQGGLIRNCVVGQHAVVILRGGRMDRCTVDGGLVFVEHGTIGGGSDEFDIARP